MLLPERILRICLLDLRHLESSTIGMPALPIKVHIAIGLQRLYLLQALQHSRVDLTWREKLPSALVHLHIRQQAPLHTPKSHLPLCIEKVPSPLSAACFIADKACVSLQTCCTVLR